MSIQFKRENNYINEVKIFLARYFSGETIRVIHERMKHRTGYTAYAEKTYHVLETIYDELIEQVSIPEEIRFYFDGFDSEERFQYSLAECILYEVNYECAVKEEDMGEYVKQKFSENPNKFRNIVLSEERIEGSISENAFMDALDMQYADEKLKWNIWRVYKNFDKHVDQLMNVVYTILPIMKEIYQKHQSELQEFALYWEDKCKDIASFTAILDDIVSLNLDGDSQLVVRPNWMGCNSIRLFVADDPNAKMEMEIGVTFLDKVVFSINQFSKEEVGSCLKLISDGSKYEILKLVKENRLYGSQLAEKLSLTTATISHHVNALLSARLISVEKDSNRIYYRNNKVKIAALLDQIRKDLYEDELS